MKKIDVFREFREDYVSRAAGERLREIILAAAKDDRKIELDFSDKIVASTSFFDEGFAKLAENGWTRKNLQERVALLRLSSPDAKVLDEMCKRRKMK